MGGGKRRGGEGGGEREKTEFSPDENSQLWEEGEEGMEGEEEGCMKVREARSRYVANE